MTSVGVLAILACYVIGSIPFGYVVGRLKGVDIRKSGSGNTGATNVTRALGIGPGLLVLALDASKGAAGVFIARAFMGFSVPFSSLIGGISALIGHNYSVFLGFRGGRGVATGLGVSLCLIPYWTLVAGLVFLVVVALTRYVSLGSILATVVVIGLSAVSRAPIEYKAFVLCAGLLIIIRHRSNIARLLRREEHKFTLGSRRK